jgi:hypothetical protein
MLVLDIMAVDSQVVVGPVDQQGPLYSGAS